MLKTDNQNKTFHKLLNIYWLSGCSSFLSYEELRLHYKRIAGLVKVKYESTLETDTKNILWKAIKILPISERERQKIIMLLKGRYEIIESWSTATKEQARHCLEVLLFDMEQSCVSSSSKGREYEEILRGLNGFIDNKR